MHPVPAPGASSWLGTGTASPRASWGHPSERLVMQGMPPSRLRKLFPVLPSITKGSTELVRVREGRRQQPGPAPASTPRPGAAAANSPATRALAGPRGYFGNFQHHPERCPMLLFINPLAPAQLQAALMQEKARRSQDKQSQQHPCAAGGDAGRAKDAPAQTPGPGGPRKQLGGARAQLGLLQDQSPSTPPTAVPWLQRSPRTSPMEMRAVKTQTLRVLPRSRAQGAGGEGPDLSRRGKGAARAPQHQLRPLAARPQSGYCQRAARDTSVPGN